jgi:uncharacterized repeat protein (TIGR01451 family)
MMPQSLLPRSTPAATRPRCKTLLALGFATLLPVAPLSAQQDVTLEKATNGQDADAPPGPVLVQGDPVTWTYTVANTGSRDLSNIVVTDDQGVTVTCPASTLPAGESMVCSGNGVATLGQYANIGTVTAELPNATLVEDSDPSHYFGQAAPIVELEKATNGVDADFPPGPILPVGSAILWTYAVTNTSLTLDLIDVQVTDDQGVTVSCPASTLSAGSSMTCTGTGFAQPGQYANLGSVTATIDGLGSPTGASDPSHYFGQLISLEKATNGVDADLPPGPLLDVGAPVSWTYTVTNPGPETVTTLAVTDDQGVTVSCPVTTLAAGESTVCTGNGIAQAGQYANVGTATATLPGGAQISASDPSHYFGQSLRIEKSTNGEDADLPPGPVLAVGAAVSWTYTLTNLGVDPVTDVTVTDDQGVTVSCPATSLAAGASMVCTANGVAQAGQYTNLGTAEATHPTLGQLVDSDPSHYFGQDQVLDFGDAAGLFTTLAQDGARHRLGSTVFLGACVDSELDATTSANADGDDSSPGIATFGTCATAGGDEDGVVVLGPLVPGQTAGLRVLANAACTLSAWIDFTPNGLFSDPGEDLFPGGTLLVAGNNDLSVSVPAGAVPGPVIGRFRCTTDGATTPVGDAADGEVEDHQLTIEAPAALAASKTVTLTADINGDALASPGDGLTYTIVVSNTGGTALEVTLTDTPDAATSLIAGSVTTTQGTVTTGNTAGDITVAVAVGDLPGGGSVTVSFQVAIADPLPAGVSEVANQALVGATGLAVVPSDDPGTASPGDPTALAVGTPVSILEIPTLGTLGGTLLAAFLAVAALVSGHRRRRAVPR